jgi:hypothetical protein
MIERLILVQVGSSITQCIWLMNIMYTNNQTNVRNQENDQF